MDAAARPPALSGRQRKAHSSHKTQGWRPPNPASASAPPRAPLAPHSSQPQTRGLQTYDKDVQTALRRKRRTASREHLELGPQVPGSLQDARVAVQERRPRPCPQRPPQKRGHQDLGLGGSSPLSLADTKGPGPHAAPPRSSTLEVSREGMGPGPPPTRSRRRPWKGHLPPLGSSERRLCGAEGERCRLPPAEGVSGYPARTPPPRGLQRRPSAWTDSRGSFR
nr:proline-rich proteoglycan 2-like [Oryctolagus cuniculus]